MKKGIALFAVLSAVFMYAIAQPDINSVNDAPDPVEVPGYNNITVNVTNADAVYVEIYYPNATLKGNYSMTNISSYLWFYNATYGYPDPLGVYNYTIKAYNSTGWNVSSGYNFTLQDTTLPNTSVDALPQYWYNVNASITATASDNYAIQSVSLRYRYSSDNSSWGSWTVFGSDTSPPWEWTFDFPDGDGYYRFLTIATDTAGNTESWPSVYDENSAYDSVSPSSTASVVQYWHNSLPVSITATASDALSGVEEVSLYYRYSSDNSSWGSWTVFGSDTSPPWEWTFDFPDGDGYYRFLTIATDTAGNTESWPSVYDENSAYDSVSPSSTASVVQYWHNSLPVSITATASDALSGVEEVSLYYRYSSDNSSWGSWTVFGSDTSPPWEWNFSAPDGDGYYRFYTIATDVAGNVESAPTTFDDSIGIDTTAPSTSITATPSYGNYISSSSSINLTSTDSTSGVNTTYYRVWNGSWVPAPGTGMGKGNNFSVYSGNFSLSDEGLHFIEFYSDDIAGNEESTHNVSYIVDNTPPSILNIMAVPPSQVAGGHVNVSCSITDSGAGVDNSQVYLEVIYPDNSFANFSMHYIHCSTYYRNETYSTIGIYNYTIFVKDNLGNSAKSGVYHFTIYSANLPPATPSQPSGPASGFSGSSYIYSSVTTDPDGDNIYYFFDWGDNTTSGWVGPYASGSSGSASHSWSSPGTYYVKVKAKDVHDAESGWSSSLTVVIQSPNAHPITTCSLNPPTPNGKNGWYISQVNVTLNATDPEGDAIAYTRYRIDRGSWITYNGTFTISQDGEHLLEFYSADDKGNIEPTNSMRIKIDKSEPYVVLQRPAPGYLYLFDRQIIPISSGTTIIIGRIVVRAIAYDGESSIENVSFYVNGRLQSIDMKQPYEWLWRGDLGFKYLQAVAYNKAGLMEESMPVLVYIFSL